MDLSNNAALTKVVAETLNTSSVIEKTTDAEAQELFGKMLELQGNFEKVQLLMKALKISQETFDFKYDFLAIYQRLIKGLWTEQDEKMYADNLRFQVEAKNPEKPMRLCTESIFYLLRDGRDLSLYS